MAAIETASQSGGWDMATWIDGEPVRVIAGMTRSRWLLLPFTEFASGMGVKVDDERKFVHLIDRRGKPVGNPIKFWDDAPAGGGSKEDAINVCKSFGS
jgi:hypothetical protein